MLAPCSAGLEVFWTDRGDKLDRYALIAVKSGRPSSHNRPTAENPGLAQ